MARVICAGCNRSLPANAQFCGYCGHASSQPWPLPFGRVLGFRLPGGVRSLAPWCLAGVVGVSALITRSFLATAIPGRPMHPGHVATTWSSWAFAHFLIGVAACFWWAVLQKGRTVGSVLNREFARTSLAWGLVAALVGAIRITWYPLAVVDYLLLPFVSTIGGSLSWGLLGAVAGYTAAHRWTTSPPPKHAARWKMVPALTVLVLVLAQAQYHGTFTTIWEHMGGLVAYVTQMVKREPRPPDPQAVKQWTEASALLDEVEAALKKWVQDPDRSEPELQRREQWITNTCDRVLRLCDGAISLEKRYPKPFLYRVQGLRFLGRYSDAMKECEAALKSFPDDADLKAERTLLTRKLSSGGGGR